MGSDLATVKFEHDFSDNLTLRNQLRYGYSTTEFDRHTAALRQQRLHRDQPRDARRG